VPLFAVVIHEKGGAERREVFETSEISVGRVQGNDLMLPKGNVSKRHARVLHRDGRFIVTDLNSTNGTYVNRRRITQATIVREGDRIFIGDFVLRVESADPTGDAPPPAPSLTPGPRPTASDSGQPSGAMRSAADDDDELTGSMPRMVAAPRLPVPNVDAPPAPSPAARAARTTQSDEEDTQRALTLDFVAELVTRVSRALPSSILENSRGQELADRVEPVLRDAWTQLSGERPGRAPSEAAVDLARGELLELGALTELLADGNVSEIALVGPRRVSVTRSGRARPHAPGFSGDAGLRLALARLCVAAGEPLGDALPVERRLPDGTRVSATRGASGEWLVVLRKSRRLFGSLEDLVRRGTISRAIATFLHQCLTARLNLLVVGPRDGGTDLILGALAAAVPDEEILYAGELDASFDNDSRRVALGGPPGQVAHAIRLATRVPLGRLMVELGQASLSEAVCSAIGDGGDGVIAFRTAGSLRRGLVRLVSDLGRDRDASSARELVAGSFEVVIEIARLRDERHRVLRVAEVAGTQGEDFELLDIFTFVADRTAAGGLIEGSFVPAANTPPVTELLRLRGVATDSSLFSRPPSR
jgi:pilus assembly protein CpaF